ncbi:MAG TPA: LapA family protein [Acidimicrobiales bacterium]|nr:LapA family protein [Acidimicrobiales bacterium]
MTEIPDVGPDHDEMDHVMRRRRRRAIRGLLALALVVIVVVFVIQNSQRVPVHFWFFTHRAPLIWVILACLAAGTAFGYVLGVPDRRARRRRRKAERAARRSR